MKKIIVGSCVYFILGLNTLGYSADTTEELTSFGSKKNINLTTSSVVARSPALEKLEASLGGSDVLSTLDSLSIEAMATRYLTKQGFRAADDPVVASTLKRTLSVDLSKDWLRLDIDRDVEYFFPQNERMTHTIRGFTGVTTQTSFDGQPLEVLRSDRVAAIRRNEELLHPHLFYAKFSAVGFEQGEDTTLEGVRHHQLSVVGSDPSITLYIHAETGELSRVETMENDFVLRDVLVQANYSAWKTSPEGVGYPSEVEILAGGHRLIRQEVMSIVANSVIDDEIFAFPEGASPVLDEQLYERGLRSAMWFFGLESVGLPPDAPVSGSLDIKEIGEGVFALISPTHISLLIEQEAGLVLVDAALSEERGLELVETLSDRFPTKEITHVVASHFHADHIGGIRQVLGLTQATLVVHENSGEFWRQVVTANSTVVPDALENNPRNVRIIKVPDDEQFVLRDSKHPVQLFDMNANHADDLLLVREPSTNTLFTVDVYSPGFGSQIESTAVDRVIRRFSIPTEEMKLVGGHDPDIGSYEDLQKSLPSEPDILRKIIYSLGGPQALDTYEGFRVVARGNRFSPGQAVDPGGAPRPLGGFHSVVSVERHSENIRIDYQSRNVKYLDVGELNYSELTLGDAGGRVGTVIGVDTVFGGTGEMRSDRWAAVRKEQALLNPHLILNQAFADPSLAVAIAPASLKGIEHERLEVNWDGDNYQFWVRPYTGSITKVVTTDNDLLLRDTTLEAVYSRWRAKKGEVKFPARVGLISAKRLVHTERRKVEINPSFAPNTFALPEDARPVYSQEYHERGRRDSQTINELMAFGFPFYTADEGFSTTEIAPGVWFISGSYNSLAIEQDDGVVFVEAPVSPNRGLALLNWAKTQFPNKSVTHVIATHTHQGHIAGLRSFFAAGIPVVAIENARTLLSKIFRATSTISPDALEHNPMPATIIGVPRFSKISLNPVDSQPVVVYHLPSEHASDMALVYLPAIGLVFQSDMYDPGLSSMNTPEDPFPVTNSLAELYATVTANSVKVETIAGGHGGFAPFSEFLAVLESCTRFDSRVECRPPDHQPSCMNR
ncbi:MAG: MBL fold metallo-hydrolase [Myxococcales bacterium]|nr:MBL fold metallo-hydrolase [Myxococcales bacterium]